MKITKLLFCFAFMMALHTFPTLADNTDNEKRQWVWSKIEWESKDEITRQNIGLTEEALNDMKSGKRKKKVKATCVWNYFPKCTQTIWVNGNQLDVTISHVGSGFPWCNIRIDKHDNVLTFLAAKGRFCADFPCVVSDREIDKWIYAGCKKEDFNLANVRPIDITENTDTVWLITKGEDSTGYEPIEMKLDTANNQLLFYIKGEALGALSLNDL